MSNLWEAWIRNKESILILVNTSKYTVGVLKYVKALVKVANDNNKEYLMAPDIVLIIAFEMLLRTFNIYILLSIIALLYILLICMYVRWKLYACQM